MSTIEEMIATGETLAVEFKREANDDSIVASCVCLANGGGGRLLIGVADDGAVVGAAPRHGDGIDLRRVESFISNKTRPSLGVQARVEHVQQRPILVIEVPSASVPTATSGGVYLRRTIGGDGKPACVPMFVHEMGVGFHHDPSATVVAGATMGDLDPIEIDRLRRLVREGGRGDSVLAGLNDEDICRALGGLDANGTVRGIRRVALLLFGKEEALRRLLPIHEVAWQVLDGVSVRENEFFRWPLLRIFEEITTRFRARNSSVELVDLFRTEIPDFSEDAFREALANALVHREYRQPGSIHVQLSADGIEISSPGGLPEGVHLQNLLSTPPRPRNLLLADAFKRSGLVERTGRGVDTIFHGQLRYGRAAPVYTVSDTSVSVFMPSGKPNLELVRWLGNEGRAGRVWGLSELLVLQRCMESKSVTVEECAHVIQLDSARAGVVLSRLMESGVIEPRGEGRGRTYHLSAAMYRVLGDKSGYVSASGFDGIQQEQMVLKYVAAHGRITRREAAELCKVTPRQASDLLRRLAEAGKLASHGRGRSAYYAGK